MTFPGWFVAQVTDDDLRDMRIEPRNLDYRTRPLVPWRQLVKRHYLTPGRKSRSVVPVRFVQACANGHLSDLDWKRFAHGEASGTCSGGQLWLDEGGSGGDLAQIYVRCEGCGARRVLSGEWWSWSWVEKIEKM